METLFGISMDTVMVVGLVAGILIVGGVALLAWRRPILARLALRNIPRRRAQTVLIVLGLMLATLLITAAFGTGDTMTYSLRQAFTGSLGGIDLQVQRINPAAISFSGPPTANQLTPSFDRKVFDDLRAKVGNDDRIDGWSVVYEQTGPLVDTTTSQGAGNTDIYGIGPDFRDTAGDLRTVGGQVFDVATLQPGDILLDQGGADKLNAQKGDTIKINVQGRSQQFRVRDIVVYGTPSSQFPACFIRLDQAQQLYNEPGKLTAIDISLEGGPLDGVKYSDEVTDKLSALIDTQTYEVNQVKKTALNAANLVGNLFSTIFVAVSLFSLAAGVLLIFLIFTMLAAERKSEMGMARAVGTQRGHLTQMFVFEGLAYDLAAAAVGAALGIGVGFAMVGIMSALIGQYGFSLTPHIEVRSVVVAYCIGMLITFLTVAISAARVSQLNVVAAIRNIPDAPKPPRKLRDQVAEPFNRLAAGQPMGCIGGLFSLLFSLFISGPVAGTLGVLLFVLGWTLNNGFFFHAGASLALVALGMTIRWILGRWHVRPARRDRIAFTIAGLALVIYWILPIDVLHDWIGAPAFGQDNVTNIVAVGGLMSVLGIVWVIMYNADILLKGLSLVLAPFSRMRPVIKTAVAYPMSAIFRTGMAIAMFALVMFLLIIISVLTQVNQQIDPNKPEVSGGYDIEASASFSNPISDIQGKIAADPKLAGKFSSVAGETLFPLELRQVGAKPPTAQPSEAQLRRQPSLKEGWRYYSSRFVDDQFLKDNEFQLSIRARGYNSDRAVWDAMLKDPSLVAIDMTPVTLGEVGAGSSFEPQIFYITGVKSSNPVMDPVEVEARAPGVPNSPVIRVKVIGVLSRFANFYTGMYVSKKLVQQAIPFPIPTTTYFFRSKPGEDKEALRRELGSAFLNNGLEPAIISDNIRKSLSLSQGLTALLQGFLGLGLLVGVAALGVISTRAVVERRQQIGVLRAIGYQRSMVAASFLLESSFIALLGILVGVGLGLIMSFNMVQFIRRETPTVEYSVPWLEIVLIVVASYLVAMVTTIMPSRSASRIYPAEALRYE